MAASQVVRLEMALGVLVLLALGSFTSSELAPRALAHGVADQVNEGRILGPGDVPSSSVNTIDGVERLGQEFTPSATSVTAVDLRLVPVNEPHASSITVRIRQGPAEQCGIGESGLLECPVGFGGAILAQSTHDVAQVDGWVHFDFPSPAAVVPGNVYLISVQSTNFGYGWWRDEGNHYTGGQAAPGFPGNGTDFLFRTFAAPESPPVTVTPSSPSPKPSLSPSLSATPALDPCAEPSPSAASFSGTPPAVTQVPAPADEPATATASPSRPTETDTPVASATVTPMPEASVNATDAATAAPPTLEPMESPSPTPEVECDLDESAPIGTTEQAIALAAVGALVAGSAIALPAAALRRARRKP